MYLFVYRNITSGGCESLIINLAKQFKKSGYRVICICETIEKSERIIFLRNQILVKEIRLWSELTEYIKKLEYSGQLNILTFEWETFCTIFLCERKDKKTILYTIHPKTLIGFGDRDDFRETYKNEAKRFIMILAKQGHIVVMDEAVSGKAIDYYDTVFEMKIIRIGIDIETKQELQSATSFIKPPRMLTVARAEFPFKGYLLGLIKWFGGYKNTELVLEIVSYGEGIDLIRKEIDKLPLHKKNRIVLYDKMEYEEFKQLLIGKTIYVGMGTSILDAAEQGVLSIPVQPESYNVLCNGFFHEYPYVCADKSLGYIEFAVLVDMAMRMSAEDYQRVREQNMEIVKKIYSTQVVTDSIKALFFNLAYDYTKQNALEVSAWRQIEQFEQEKIKKRLTSVKTFLDNRKIIIWGAGKGGKDLLNWMEKFDMEIFGFVDKNFTKDKKCIGYFIESIDMLDCNTNYVIISLKKFEYEIIKILRSKGFVYQKDFIYPYCEAEAKEESNV